MVAVAVVQAWAHMRGNLRETLDTARPATAAAAATAGAQTAHMSCLELAAAAGSFIYSRRLLRSPDDMREMQRARSSLTSQLDRSL